jgi:hypothetical protein
MKTQQITRAARKLKRQYERGMCAAPKLPNHYPDSQHGWKRAGKFHLLELRRAERLAVRRFYNAVFERAKQMNLTDAHKLAMWELVP